MSLQDLLPERYRNPWIGVPVAVLTGVALTAIIAPFRQEFGRLDTGLLFLFFTVLIASIWGIRAGIVAAAVDFFCLNFFFVPPLHKIVIHDPKNLGSWVLEVGVFLTAAFVAGRRTVATFDA